MDHAVSLRRRNGADYIYGRGLIGLGYGCEKAAAMSVSITALSVGTRMLMMPCGI